jgi:hypothetical protein
MSLNIAPVYAKQYIRYAETWEAATDNEDGDVGVVEIGEFRVVAYATYAGANKCCTPGDLDAPFSGAIVGVNQAYIPTALAQPYTARQASIATSGMLIVEVAPGADPIALNTQLVVDGAGRAVATGDGTAVTLNGTTPRVREVVEIGGRTVVLVSFN